MISQFGGNSWRTLYPTIAEGANREFQAQTMMEIAKVIEAAYEVHTSHQGFGTTSQCTGASHQVVQSLAEGGVEPFDEGCIDPTFSFLGCLDQAFYHFFVTLHNASVHGQHTFRPLLDDLHNGNVRPGDQLATTDFSTPTRQFAAKSQSESGDVTGQAIHRQQ